MPLLLASRDQIVPGKTLELPCPRVACRATLPRATTPHWGGTFSRRRKSANEHARFDLSSKELTGIQSARQHIFDDQIRMVLTVVQDFVEAVGLNPELDAVYQRGIASCRTSQARCHRGADRGLDEIPARKRHTRKSTSRRTGYRAAYRTRSS